MSMSSSSPSSQTKKANKKSQEFQPDAKAVELAGARDATTTLSPTPPSAEELQKMADADLTRRRAERELTLANIKSARLTLERLQNELVRLDLLGIPDLVDIEPSDASRATASRAAR